MFRMAVRKAKGAFAGLAASAVAVSAAFADSPVCWRYKVTPGEALSGEGLQPVLDVLNTVHLELTSQKDGDTLLGSAVFLTKGKDSKIFNNDLLHVILFQNNIAVLDSIYGKENDIENAAGEYYGLIVRNPKNIEYTIALTNIYIKRHEYLKARRVLEAYFKANPEDKGNPRLAPYGIVRLGL